MTQFGFPLGGDLLDGDRYLTWDAAYVLGSLSSAERREYEAHLETCDRCRSAVADTQRSACAARQTRPRRPPGPSTTGTREDTPPLRPEVLDSVLDKVLLAPAPLTAG